MTLNFSTALDLLKSGSKITRAKWNGKGQWIELQSPDKHSKMTLPYIFIHTMQGNLVPWQGSQTDLLSDDWLEYFGVEQSVNVRTS